MAKFYLGDVPIPETNPKKLFAIVLSSISDITFWSTEAIIEFVSGTFECIKDYAVERRSCLDKGKHNSKERTMLTKFIKSDIKIPKNRDKLLVWYYQKILSLEGKGLLVGFGMENSLENPEINSIKGSL
jgi:hypothetical protein